MSKKQYKIIKEFDRAMKKNISPWTGYEMGAMLAIVVLVAGVVFYHFGVENATASAERTEHFSHLVSERQAFASQGLSEAWDYAAAYALGYIVQYFGYVLIVLAMVLLIHGFKVIGR